MTDLQLPPGRSGVRTGEDAGIPFHWIVDLDEPVSVVACHRAGEFGYQDGGAVTGRFTTGDPFEVTLELDELF